jgi:hypothetical protein
MGVGAPKHLQSTVGQPYLKQRLFRRGSWSQWSYVQNKTVGRKEFPEPPLQNQHDNSTRLELHDSRSSHTHNFGRLRRNRKSQWSFSTSPAQTKHEPGRS